MLFRHQGMSGSGRYSRLCIHASAEFVYLKQIYNNAIGMKNDSVYTNTIGSLFTFI